MKQVLSTTIPRILLVGFFCLFTLLLQAQDSTGSSSETRSTTTVTTKNTDTTITTDGTWYTQPWVWIVGAAIFILLLVALLSGGRQRDTASARDRIVIKKTVERDSDNT